MAILNYRLHIFDAAAEMYKTQQMRAGTPFAQWKFVEDIAEAHEYDVFKTSFRLNGEAWTKELGHMLYQIDYGEDAMPDKDTAHLLEKDEKYGGSWAKRGGQGAFFATARKMDRMVEQVQGAGSIDNAFSVWSGTDGFSDTVGDLRRYLILWSAWWKAEDQLAVEKLGRG